MLKVYQSIVSTVLGLKRVCPSCGVANIVTREMKHKVCVCKSCGTKIPVPANPHDPRTRKSEQMRAHRR